MQATTNNPPRPPELDPACKFYRPRGAAKDLFPCRATEVLIEGPAGTGKTRGVLEKINRWLLKCPGSRALIVRKTRASMTESVLVTFEQNVVPDNPALYPDVRNQLRRNRQAYHYPNGSTLVVGGLDNPERIMSTEFDLIACFEATEAAEADWEMLLTRLRNGVMPFQQAIADVNPGPPHHWLNQRARTGRMVRLLSRHHDNPRLHDGVKWTEQGEKYLTLLQQSLTGSRYLRLFGGKWAAAEGIVYDDFDADVHVIDPFPVPPTWRRLRSIDFGLRNPFVCQWWAVDPDGRMVLYREIYMTERLVGVHAVQVNAKSEGERYSVTVSDHDSDDRATLHAAGIHTIAAWKAIKPGVEAVQKRLKLQKDGKPRLMVMRGCRVELDQALANAKLPTCTEEEFDGYVYETGVDGKPRKEEPRDLNNHGMDAMRYAVAHVDGLGPTVRIVGGYTQVAKPA